MTQVTCHAVENVEQGKYYFIIGGSASLHSNYENQFVVQKRYRNPFTSRSIYNTFGLITTGFFIILQRYLLSHAHCWFITVARNWIETGVHQWIMKMWYFDIMETKSWNFQVKWWLIKIINLNELILMKKDNYGVHFLICKC